MVRRHPKGVEYATVPRLLPHGGSVLVLGSGKSLVQGDVDVVRAHVSATIAVNDSYKMAPDATVLYAADSKWWGWHKGVQGPHTVGSVKYPAFTGQFKFALNKTPYRDVLVLRRGQQSGLATDPTTVNTGLNGVYQAMNLSVHLGATRIILLGVDMRGPHFFGHHPDQSNAPFSMCLKHFETLVEPMRKAGVEVINCTPKSALTVFPCLSIEDALGIREQIAV